MTATRPLRGIARYRTVAILTGLALVAVNVPLERRWLALTALALILGGVALVFVSSTPRGRNAVHIASPVRGRWVAVNSPADKVPSHGTHELGQTYAIDLVHVPDGEFKAIRPGILPAAASAFPTFGLPLYAPADGVIVSASAWQRDHRARNTWPGFLYLLAEMIPRQILSLPTLSTSRFIIGNHIILDLGDEVYGVFAHVRRGSLRVRPGDHVRAGTVLGEVGNSGNSSEPHLHFHLMDRPRPNSAAGIPFTLDYTPEPAAEPRTGVPGSGPAFHLEPAAASRATGRNANAHPGAG